jgi:hypothetical protein
MKTGTHIEFNVRLILSIRKEGTNLGCFLLGFNGMPSVTCFFSSTNVVIHIIKPALFQLAIVDISALILHPSILGWLPKDC